MTYSTEATVFEVIPADISKPADVRIDGKGGVTTSTFLSFQAQYGRFIEAELVTAGLSVPEADADGNYDLLLVMAESAMVAGAVMRKLNSWQQHSKDAYATGNMSLRKYIDAQMKLLGLGTSAPSFLEDTSEYISGFPTL